MTDPIFMMLRESGLNIHDSIKIENEIARLREENEKLKKRVSLIKQTKTERLFDRLIKCEEKFEELKKTLAEKLNDETHRE